VNKTILTEEENDAGVIVRDDDGATFTVDFLSFENCPIKVAVTMPKTMSEKAIRKAIITLAENVDVYVDLIRQYNESRNLRQTPVRRPRINHKPSVKASP